MLLVLRVRNHKREYGLLYMLHINLSYHKAPDTPPAKLILRRCVQPYERPQRPRSGPPAV